MVRVGKPILYTRAVRLISSDGRAGKPLCAFREIRYRRQSRVSLARDWRANNTRWTATAADMYTNRARLSHQRINLLLCACFMQYICKFFASVETLSVCAVRTVVLCENHNEIKSLEKKNPLRYLCNKIFL